MRSGDYPREFIGAAEDDSYMADTVIDDCNALDSGVDFHCQRAAERLLKAVLAHHGVQCRRSHALTHTFQAVEAPSTSVPPHLTELTHLNPFAAVLRYESPRIMADCDRRRRRGLLEALRRWIEVQVATSA